MKRHFLIFIILLGGFISCEKNDTDKVLEKGYCLCFSEYISDELMIQAAKNPSEETVSFMKEGPYTSYEDVLIRFAPLVVNTAPSSFEYNEYNKAVSRWSYDIVDPLYPEHKSDVQAPYMTACLDQGIEIVADTPLFGELPGTDLSNHFQILTKPSCSSFRGHLLKSFDYEVVYPYDPWDGTSLPTEIKDYFFDGAVLFFGTQPYDVLETAYCIIFKDYPVEAPKELTLTIQLPVREKLFSDAFGQDGSYDATKVNHRERTLSGSIHLSFKD